MRESMKLKIDVPNIGIVTVVSSAPVGSELLLKRIQDLLESDYNATVVNRDHTPLEHYTPPQTLDDRDGELVSNTIWILKSLENNKPTSVVENPVEMISVSENYYKDLVKSIESSGVRKSPERMSRKSAA